MDSKGNVLVRDGIIAIVATLFLSFMSVGSLLTAVPILLFCRNIKDTGKAVLIEAGLFLVVLGLQVFLIKDLLFSKNWAVAVFGILFLLCSILESLIYTGLRDFSDAILRKFVLSSFPVMLITTAFGIFLTSSAGYEAKSFIAQTLNEFSDVIMHREMMDGEMVLSIISFIYCPTTLVISGLPVVISELAGRKGNEYWQKQFADMKMPKIFVWGYLILGIGSGLSIFTEVVPLWLSCLVFNLFFGISVHYFMNGISIIYSRYRLKTDKIGFGYMLFLFVLAGTIPVFGVIVFVLTILLAIAENWIQMR